MSAPDPEQIPVDTLEAPHEPAAWTRSTSRFWVLLLAGPVVWIVQFAVVYLAAETACAPSGRWSRLDEESLPELIVIVTIVAAVACAVAAVAAWRATRAEAASPLARAAVALAIGSLVGVLVVAGPVLVLGPC